MAIQTRLKKKNFKVRDYSALLFFELISRTEAISFVFWSKGHTFVYYTVFDKKKLMRLFQIKKIVTIEASSVFVGLPYLQYGKNIRWGYHGLQQHIQLIFWNYDLNSPVAFPYEDSFAVHRKPATGTENEAKERNSAEQNKNDKHKKERANIELPSKQARIIQRLPIG